MKREVVGEIRCKNCIREGYPQAKRKVVFIENLHGAYAICLRCDVPYRNGEKKNGTTG